MELGITINGDWTIRTLDDLYPRRFVPRTFWTIRTLVWTIRTQAWPIRTQFYTLVLAIYIQSWLSIIIHQMLEF